jgi:membrane associated rhomboid family serine protease
VKEVNRIFFKNYSGDSKATTASDTLMKTVWLPVVVLIGLGLTLPFCAFPYQHMAFLGMLGVVVGMLGVAAILAFLERPSDNNQIQQSIEDVRSLFKRIN